MKSQIGTIGSLGPPFIGAMIWGEGQHILDFSIYMPGSYLHRASIARPTLSEVSEMSQLSVRARIKGPKGPEILAMQSQFLLF